MKNLFLLVFAALAIVACQQQEQRYFGESDETKILEAGIAAYEASDWDKWRSHFADTAKIYVNSTEPMDIDTRVANLSGMTETLSSYGFEKENAHIEMVIDKDDETWVYYWADHKGTFAANNKELTIPVHLAVRFVDGKIVSEHVYFDGTEMNAVMAELAAGAETAEGTEDAQ